MVVTGHTSAGQPDPADAEAAGRGKRAASIRDVAAAAGVSYQTVSRVINGHPRVKPATRDLVRAAIESLGFRPNRAARALAGGPVQSVTVLTPDTSLYGSSAALQGIEEAARAAGFAVGIRVVESAEPDEVSDAVMRAIEPGGALIVIAYYKAGTMTLGAIPPRIPMAALVETPTGDEGEGKPWVWLDDRKAALDATRYLLDLGHRTVHYVSIPYSSRVSQRMEGWRAALQMADAPVPEPIHAGWTPRSGYLAGQSLAADPDVTAVLCGNDDLALGVMRAMHQAGRVIPEQVSIVGFDDIPSAGFLTPPLTTVRMDFTELGRACFALLRGLVDPRVADPSSGDRGEGFPRSRPEPPQPELIVRESAGPPPASRAPSMGGRG